MIALLLSSGSAAAQAVGIAAIVNDEPVSAWDVDQRAEFYKITGGGKASAKALRERALKELVDELLMRQEVKRLGIEVPNQEIIASINARLRPLKREHGQFKKFLASQGVRIATLENRLRARLGWQQVIQRTYGNLVSITESDIEEAVEDLEPAGTVTEKMALQRIVLSLPAGAGDAVLLKRMEEAERIRSTFVDCARNKTTSKRYQNIKLTDIPDAKPSDLQEPTRSLVSQTDAGQMTPPNLTTDGVEMIAVCGKSKDGGRRLTAQRQLVNQELGMLSDRHLRDLRQDAVIDYR